MVYFAIAAYVVLGIAFLVAEGKKALACATLLMVLSGGMAFWSYWNTEPFWEMAVYFGVGVVFAVLAWASVSDALAIKTDRNQFVAALLALFFGGIGVHKYYLGKYGSALIYLLFAWTGIPLCLSVLEFVYLVSIPKAVFLAKNYVATDKKVQTNPTVQPQPSSPMAKNHPVSARPTQNTAVAPVAVSADHIANDGENSTISAEMAGKYKAVQFVLDDALQKANAIRVLGEQEGHELAAIKEMLKKLNEDFRVEIERLKNASEWDRFCIAFFGETNAGKSTIIESLRILYDEESKRVEAMEQQAEYYALMKQHCADYQDLIVSLEAVNAALEEHYGKKKQWLTCLLVGLISAVVGLVVGYLLAR